MKEKKQKVIAIVGPTSSGKSALGVYLAKKLGGEVISADSRQVYRGVDLISGKVTQREMGGVPHHMLSIADPKKPYSVQMYATHAAKIIEGIRQRGKVPIILGGTGFYIDALLRGISLPSVLPNASLRRRLSKKSASQLFILLKKLDPHRAKTIDCNNPVRLVRAIEIAKALGKVPKIKKQNYTIYRTLFIGLDLPDKILKKKIRARIKERLTKGMVQEAKLLRKDGVSLKRMRSLGLELRHLADLLEGKISRKDFIDNLAIDIWHYAKRQRTWFRRHKDVVWLAPRDKKKVLHRARTFLS